MTGKAQCAVILRVLPGSTRESGINGFSVLVAVCLRTAGAFASRRTGSGPRQRILMTTFQRHSGVMHCEGVSLERIAKVHGTPCYVYSQSAIEDALGAYQAALGDAPHLICYAVKANSNLAILNVLAKRGAGFDVVSLGELERVVLAGGDPTRVVFSGVGKTVLEIERALALGIRCFNVESEAELSAIADTAQRLEKIAPISIRVNPDVDAGTHPYISTGLRENKFGVDIATARRLYRFAAEHAALDPVGIDCHIGSQILDVAPFEQSIDCLLGLLGELTASGNALRHLDLGGGLGVSYQTDAPTINEYIGVIREKLAGYSLELILEPGRSIVALAGVLLTKTLFLKQTEQHHFAIVDAAMNDLLRPALYGAWQDIQAVTPREGVAHDWDIVGPVCETADFLGKQRSLVLQEGDLLAVMGAGAYGFAMASSYNSRPRVAEVLVKGNDMHLIGERETLSDLWARERIPNEAAS